VIAQEIINSVRFKYLNKNLFQVSINNAKNAIQMPVIVHHLKFVVQVLINAVVFAYWMLNAKDKLKFA